MNRLVIVVAITIIIVIAGLIIFIAPWEVDPPPPPRLEGEASDEETTEIDDDSSVVREPREPRTPPTPPIQSVTETVSISINAIPWARVFIKLPENDYFMEPRPQDFTIPPEPNQKEPNVTPIPGDLKVPSGTAIKLMYRGKEKIFPYEVWRAGRTISHDFLNQ